MKLFQAPKETLGDLDAEAAATVIATAADVALVLNAQGVIQDLAFPRAELASEFADAAEWIGRSWADTLIEESRPKVRALLDEATGTTTSRWRQLNHRAPSGAEFPILYSVVKIGTRSLCGGRARPAHARDPAAAAGRSADVDGARLFAPAACRDPLPDSVPDLCRAGARRRCHDRQGRRSQSGRHPAVRRQRRSHDRQRVSGRSYGRRPAVAARFVDIGTGRARTSRTCASA